MGFRDLSDDALDIVERVLWVVAHLVQGLGFGLVFKAHGLVYHSTLGLGIIKKKSLGFRV